MKLKFTAKSSQNALIKESEENCAKLRESVEESETARRKEEESAQELEMQLSQNKELLQQSDVRYKMLLLYYFIRFVDLFFTRFRGIYWWYFLDRNIIY